MAFRIAIPDFALDNPIYSGAPVSFYTVDGSGEATSTLASLYQDPVGSTLLTNPQVLDSQGKFVRPIYIEGEVIGSVDLGGSEAQTTGIIGFRFNWRGAWATATIYAPGDFVRVTGVDGDLVYVATTRHTSGTFSTDLAASKWSLVIQAGNETIVSDFMASILIATSLSEFLELLGLTDGGQISVIDYGADRTGVTDSATAFQDAIDAACAFADAAGQGGGATVLVPSGEYLLGSQIAINCSNIRILGDVGTELRANANIADLIHVGEDGMSNPDNIVLEKLRFRPAVACTSGAQVRIDNAYNCHLREIRIDAGEGFYDGITFNGGSGQYVNKVEDIIINDPDNYGIFVGENASLGVVQELELTRVFVAGAGATGIRVHRCNGLYMLKVTSFDNTGSGFVFGPPTVLKYRITLTQCFSINNGSNGFLLDGSSSSKYVREFQMSDCFAEGNANNGLYILNGVDGLQVTNCRFAGNGEEGIWIDASSNANIDFTNIHVAGNNQNASGAHGVRIRFNATRIGFTGGRIGIAGQYQSATQAYGIKLIGGTNIRIFGLDLSGNVTGGADVSGASNVVPSTLSDANILS